MVIGGSIEQDKAHARRHQGKKTMLKTTIRASLMAAAATLALSSLPAAAQQKPIIGLITRPTPTRSS